MKIKHVFTVTRYSSIEDKDLDSEIEFFEGGMKDETGEYLYGGSGEKEDITVEMFVKKGNDWIEILGEATAELAKG